jgi:hypothetical protein
MTRQNYYARRKLRRRRVVDGELVAKLVQQERCVQPRLGGRKLRVLLQEPLAEAGVKLGGTDFLKYCVSLICCWSPGVRSGHERPIPVTTCRCSGIW